MNAEHRQILVNSLKASKGWMTGYAEAFVDDCMQNPRPSVDSRDARRWRTFVKGLRTRLPGPAHGTRIKVVEVCPMYGDEKDVDDITALIDTAMGERHG